MKRVGNLYIVVTLSCSDKYVTFSNRYYFEVLLSEVCEDFHLRRIIRLPYYELQSFSSMVWNSHSKEWQYAVRVANIGNSSDVGNSWKQGVHTA